ncbi:hypothetical protein IU471_08470 [Nocardia elegans]|uniref:hypothetical protein n=1 Tax=Nocardia elegans TaxID=300029 RepID=UPI0018934309|nr:hypothetical protein [Nocardia elegans]MBF6243613.1 hypothetical protein [Nocardia elegans]
MAPGGPAADESSPSNPRLGSPPRMKKPYEEPSNRDDRCRSAQRPVGDPVLGWLARMLAERHGVAVVGFDLPDLEEAVVRQFAAAVDRVLTEYPVIALDVVRVADLDGAAGRVQWSSESRDDAVAAAARSITLDQRTAHKPSLVVGTSEPGAEPEDLVIYSATVRELGLALDFAGGGVARRKAQRVLIAEYMRLEAGRYTTLAEVLGGFRRWRAGLTGASGRGGFDVSRALRDAFADVVLHGEKASAPARTLHAVLLDAASSPG